jgi:arginase
MKEQNLPRRDFVRLATMAAPTVFLSYKCDAGATNISAQKASMRSIALLDAPSTLGLRPPREDHEPGVWRLPHSLRTQGIVARLRAQAVGAVSRLPYSPEPDAATGFRNGPRIVEYTTQLADKIGALLEQRCFPLVLGGDCSILLGSALALRRRGRHGLCFVDGHNDFSYPRDPQRRGSYTAAGLDLALATGHGPDALTNLDGLKPYFREEDVTALGVYRDPADEDSFDIASFYRSKIDIFEAEQIRAKGAATCARQALARVGRSELGGFWIHLDADVLNKSVMPAVDSPNDGGITVAQLVEILRVLLASPRAIGMHVTILDPELDPNGKCAATLVEALVAGFNLNEGNLRQTE